ncbi:MAG: CRISPR-associated protein Cas4 [Proteobacteria bacterium]|nr:CRISPR-associated protein Cas4 [Pseudomonadota bacterium]MCL2306918.1 CRISPR-associated protein Cas4 [Pseudomonadota bacterium]
MNESPIPLSALQHYLYCPRQCALIHIERMWSENRFTAEGRLLHDNANQPMVEKRKGVRTVTAMPLENEALGIVGVADVVEFHATEQGEQPYPVEYKRGKAKTHRADEVQLCAQALCLEEMLGKPCPEGALYYGKTRRRQVVFFDDVLCALTRQVIADSRALIDSGKTPPAQYEAKRCDACSLIDDCQPKLLTHGRNVNAWLQKALKE